MSRDRLTLEQALKFEDRTEVPEWHTQESFIDRATESYWLAVDDYNKQLLQFNRALDKTLEATAEKRVDITIVTETLEEFLYSSGIYLRFAAWSEGYIYVPARYDGLVWIEAIPKSVQKPIEPIGGG